MPRKSEIMWLFSFTFKINLCNISIIKVFYSFITADQGKVAEEYGEGTSPMDVVHSNTNCCCYLYKCRFISSEQKTSLNQIKFFLITYQISMTDSLVVKASDW